MFPTAIACCALRTEHVRARDPQRRVLLIRRHDHRVEGRILENRPPILQVAVLDVRIVCGNPFVGDRCRRGAIVRPDLETIAYPLPWAGEDASAVQCQHDGNHAHRNPPPREPRQGRLLSMLRGQPQAHESVRRLKLLGRSRVHAATANRRTIRTFRSIRMTGGAIEKNSTSSFSVDQTTNHPVTDAAQPGRRRAARDAQAIVPIVGVPTATGTVITAWFEAVPNRKSSRTRIRDVGQPSSGGLSSLVGRDPGVPRGIKPEWQPSAGKRIVSGTTGGRDRLLDFC